MTYSNETRQICLRLYVEQGHDAMWLIRGLFGVAPSTLYGWSHTAVYEYEGRTVALHTREHNKAWSGVQPCHLPYRVVAIGESHANPDSRRRQYGKARHGQLVFMCVAHGQSAPVSGICAMSRDAIEVAHVAEGNVDGNIALPRFGCM